VDLSFPHEWEAEILSARPLILPPRHFVYPREAEEVERGALEVLVKPLKTGNDVRGSAASEQPFLATCALGFRDSAVPTGIWSTPTAETICAVSGGYAYMIDTWEPERFTMISYRPVLDVRAAPGEEILLFVGHHSVLAWGPRGEAWQSGKLSDEGVTITTIGDGVLHGIGWEMMSDRETPFTLNVRSGQRL
jgi:hypothetical protein